MGRALRAEHDIIAVSSNAHHHPVLVWSIRIAAAQHPCRLQAAVSSHTVRTVLLLYVCALLCVAVRWGCRQCCDGIWLPTFVLRNAVQLPEGRVEPLYAIVVAKDNKT